MVKHTFGFLQNQTLKIREDGRREEEDGTENTAHLKITSSVLLEIHCTQIITLDVMNFQNIQKNEILRVVTSIEYFQIRTSMDRTFIKRTGHFLIFKTKVTTI